MCAETRLHTVAHRAEGACKIKWSMMLKHSVHQRPHRGSCPEALPNCREKRRDGRERGETSTRLRLISLHCSMQVSASDGRESVSSGRPVPDHPPWDRRATCRLVRLAAPVR